ncbi:MAG TPA: carbohydrate ABC transporter permease [Aggregatilineaceae bacterium]|nr:carbohydrate ABC transporter permease [Aggregatilineaceae bacterium]
MKRFLELFTNNEKRQRGYLKSEAGRMIGVGTLFMFLVFLATVYLSPLLYMGSTAIKSTVQLSDPDDHPLLPRSPQTFHTPQKAVDVFHYQPEEGSAQDLPLYLVDVEGQQKKMALLTLESATALSNEGAQEVDQTSWIDPENPQAGPINLSVDITKAVPVLVDVFQTIDYNTKVALTIDYEGQTVPVYKITLAGQRRPARYALLQQYDDGSGQFILLTGQNVVKEGAVPEDFGPEQLQIPIAQLEQVTDFGNIKAPLYQVETPDGAKTLALVNTLEDGRGEWVDPAEGQRPTPFQLETLVADATPQYMMADLDLYKVPVDGEEQQLALLSTTKEFGDTYLDPENPDRIVRPGKDIRARGLDRVWLLKPHFENFRDAVDRIDYFRLMRNTAFVALVSGFGAMASATLVAYGFTRFKIPFSNVLFIILLATIILPAQVTQIPTYIVFQKLGWIGTLAPLIVPHFFANAYNVFLLRQYMMGIPLELDEAARVDGANPLKILWYVIIPAARPALVAVYLFHFLFSWNDFQAPLIYIGGQSNNQVLAVGLQRFTQIYSSQQNLMMAAGVLTMLIPLAVFFVAQRVFMQGVVITGVEK